MRRPLLLLPAVLLSLSTAFAGRGGFSREGPNGGSVDAQGASYGRFSAGSVDATGPNGGTYNAQGASYGRFGAGSASATGPNGGTYDANAVRAGRYGSANASATGPNGGTVDAQANRYGRYSQGSVAATGANGAAYSASWSGYRTGYVYRGGAYYPANIMVRSYYVAPVGIYAGWSCYVQPYYVTYPMYATYPVEVSVQVELTRRGYYNGAIDGSVGPKTQAAIAQYQQQNGLAVTGTITAALLKSLGIVA